MCLQCAAFSRSNLQGFRSKVNGAASLTIAPPTATAKLPSVARDQHQMVNQPSHPNANKTLSIRHSGGAIGRQVVA
jgi:hypothetical protein